jgi:serine/threonine protein kinase/WD40 repeat protein
MGGDEKDTVPPKSLTLGKSLDGGKTPMIQTASESTAEPPPNAPVVFGKTYVLEELEAHFSSNGIADTLALITDDHLLRPASSVPESEESATQNAPDGHDEKRASDAGVRGTLVATERHDALPSSDPDHISPSPEADWVLSGLGENQQTLIDGEQVLPAAIEHSSQDQDSPTVESPENGATSLVRSGSSKIGSDQIRRHWANAAGDSANPMHTVKADMRDSRTTDSLNLPVKLRSVAFQAVPIDDNADYQLIQKLGEGAMGLIHKAKQHSIDRFVAFKTIKKDVADQSPETRRKFLREAQITGSLDHPNIVPIHDLGMSEDGSLFYSMKLVEGTPWQDVIAQRSRDENLETLLKVCDAVAFAHSRDVIHRDLKPENVMLGQFGEVLVMDWGLAISQRKDRDRKFSLGGTPAYMAPEMARHDVKKIGDASDIYLLGAILYQIVTGYPPHPGGTVTECVQMAGENVMIPPPDPDDELIKIALRAMSTKPEQRHRAVAEFQDAIRGYRRNAESVALAHRAQAAFDEAIEQQNYEQFSKAMFGFSDAVEIWPENAAAKSGVDRARLEYGRCALKRGDFDLALQLLRKDVGDEQPLYKKALQGKREAAEKERRIRRLRTSVLAVVSVALLILVGFSGVLAKRNTDLKRANEEKENAINVANVAKDNAQEAKEVAIEEKVKAEEASNEKDEALCVALGERENAARQEGIAKAAEAKARGLNEALQGETNRANKAAVDEKEQRQQAELARKAEAVQNRLNSFKSYPAKLNLASVRVRRQQDVTRSRELLKEIQDLEREMNDKFDPIHPESTTPLMQNWVYRRVKLLGNADLPRLSLGARVTCVDTAPEANRLAIGTQSGLIAIVSVGKDRLEIVKEMQAPDGRPIRAIALAPRGDAIAYCSGNNAHFWQLDAPSPQSWDIKGEGTVIRFTSPLPYLAVGIGTQLYRLKPDLNGKPLEGPKLVPGFGGGDVRAISSVPGRPNLMACLVVKNSGKLRQQLSLFDPVKQERPDSLELPAEIGEVKHFEFIDSNRLAVGTADGKLLPFRFDSGQIPGQLNPLTPLQTDVHTTAIQTFAFSPDRSWMISVAKDSPAIQLWRSGVGETESNWRYAWPLLGHGVEQVIAVDFFDSGKRAVSVDQSGQCMLWDPERISMRHRIANRPHFELPAAAGFELPVASGITSGNASQSDLALTINKLGVLDRWPLSECDDIRSLDAREWDYNGHPPGAELWDAAITPDGRKLITSAIIKDHRLESFNRQFCLWDVERRTMLARWGDNEAGNPVLAIAADGSTVVIGGIQTHVVTFVDGKRSAPIPITDAGNIHPPAFSMATRPNSAEVALAGDGGSVRTIELKPPYRVLAKHEYGRTTGKVQRAAWDAKGQYLFLLLDQGAIHALQWPLQIGNSGRAISGINMPIPSHREMDAEVKIRADGKPSLELALRYNDKSQSQKTQLFTVDLEPADGTLVQRPQGDAIAGNHWLVPRAPAGEPSRLLADLKLNKVQLLRSDSTGKRLVAFDQSGIHIIDTEKRQSRRLWVRQSDVEDILPERNGSLATTRDGSWRAVTLTQHSENKHADVWFAMPLGADRQGEVSWRPLNRDYKTITQLALSPDAEKLGILGDTEGTMALEVIPLNVNAAKNIEPLAGVGAFAWHPDADKLVAWMPAANNAGGKLRLQSLDDKPETIAYPRELDDPDRLDVKRLTFYRESFANPQVTPKWHVVIQADLKSQDVAQKENLAARSQIFLVPLDQTNLQANDDSSFIKLPPLEAVTAIAASSTENLLAIGTQSGTISLWLMAPSLDKKEAFEIYDFDDHRGSPIRSLAFGADGNTLISADSRGRQYAWLSTD